MKQKCIRNRILSLLLVVCLVSIWTYSGAQAAAFGDTESHWAEAAIDEWSDYGILCGYEDGTFRPNGNITRAEMAAVLDRVFCYQTSGETVFTDVPSDAWYAEAIDHLAAAGVMKGDGVNAYPQNNITREEAIVMIARAFGVAESDAAISYPDAADISSWALGYIRAMTEKGYIRGDENGQCNPRDSLTRAQAVTILNNMVDALYPTSNTPYAGTWTGDSGGYTIVSADEGITLKDMTIRSDLIITENVTGEIVLQNVTINGSVQNRSNTTVTEKTVTSAGTFSYSGHILSLFSNVPQNQLESSKFYQDDDGAMHYEGMETREGIDVSYAQGSDIDWIQVKESGIDFAMIQIGFRGWGSSGSLNIDDCFVRNISGALDAGIEVGVYFFSQATSVEEAVAEADFILPYLEKYNITYPVVYDWEKISNEPNARTNDVDKQVVTNCANAFCKRIAEAGYMPMVYFNQHDGYLWYDLSVLADYKFWYAQYDTQPNFRYAFDIWQYTDTGSVPGIPGNVDRDIQIIY